METARERVRRVYDPKHFAELGTSWVGRLRQHLESMQNEPAPVLPWTPPERLVARAAEILKSSGGGASSGTVERFRSLMEQSLRHAHRLHSPHYMGHQVPPPVPAAGLFEGILAVTNQGGAKYEMSPFATSAERALVAELGGLIGWNDGFDGFATNGGSLANLTALLAARNRRYPRAWTAGDWGVRRPAILVGEDSHYSVSRAAGIMGMGTDQVLKAALDSERRLTAANARRVLDRAEKEGRDVFALVASSCSTPTGAYDRLEELADIARQRGIWFHVDGAHGASVLFSETEKHRVRGISHADSVAWDAHKMLFVPSLCTFLLFRRREDSFAAFEQDAPYLFEPGAPAQSAYDNALRTVECTKRGLALSLWGIWCLYGPELFGDLIDITHELAKQMHGLLLEAPDFEPLHIPQSNILCFRHIPARLRGSPLETVSAFQQGLRRRLMESGEYYITSTRLEEGMALRVTLINPLTETTHLEGLLNCLRRLGETLPLC